MRNGDEGGPSRLTLAVLLALPVVVAAILLIFWP